MLRERKSVDSIQIQFIVMYLMKKPQCQYSGFVMWPFRGVYLASVYPFSATHAYNHHPQAAFGWIGGPFQLQSVLGCEFPRQNTISISSSSSPFVAIIKHVWSPLDYSNISISLNHPMIFGAGTWNHKIDYVVGDLVFLANKDM